MGSVPSLRLGALAVIVAVAVSAAQPGTAEPPDLHGQIAALSRKILHDPLDEATARALADLRRQQRRQQRDAFDALARGLEAYRDGRAAAAARALEKAVTWAAAVRMADAALPRPLRDVLKQCQQQAKGAPAYVCPVCGDTGWADCDSPGCHGSGVKRCSKCGGTGKLQAKGDTFARRCDRCEGTGYVTCPKCKGNGVVSCPRCQTGRAAPRWIVLGEDELAAANMLIDRARYQRDGGLGLDSPGALRPSPKLPK